MPSEDEIFSKQADLFLEAADLMQNRISQIEPGKDSQDIPTEDAAVRIFKVRSLRVYRDTLRFLAKEILKKDDRRHYFLLPHVRTQQDIYARFLHLRINCADLAAQALTCIAYQLLTYRALGESGYKKTLPIYKDFLIRQNFLFPEESLELTPEWVRDRNLAFVNKRKLLKPENIKDYAVYTLDVFKPSQTYEIYSYLSEFMHGNPYYYNESACNEKFWVLTMSLQTASCLIELIDRATLKKINPRDFRVWLSKINATKKDVIGLWKQRRPPEQL